MSDKNINLRRRFLHMRQLGWSRERIQRALGISMARITQLAKDIKDQGIQTYLEPRRRGLHAQASEAREIVEGEFKKEPWTLGNWKLEDVMELLKARGVDMSRAAVFQMLYRMGYRKQWVRNKVKT